MLRDEVAACSDWPMRCDMATYRTDMSVATKWKSGSLIGLCRAAAIANSCTKRQKMSGLSLSYPPTMLAFLRASITQVDQNLWWVLQDQIQVSLHGQSEGILISEERICDPSG